MELMNCPTCTKNVTNMEYLHPGDRPEICNEPNCGKAFLNMRSLSYHREMVHEQVSKECSPSQVSPVPDVQCEEMNVVSHSYPGVSFGMPVSNDQMYQNVRSQEADKNSFSDAFSSSARTGASAAYGVAHSAVGAIHFGEASSQARAPSSSQYNPYSESGTYLYPKHSAESAPPSNTNDGGVSGLGAVFAAEDELDDLDDLIS